MDKKKIFSLQDRLPDSYIHMTEMFKYTGAYLVDADKNVLIVLLDGSKDTAPGLIKQAKKKGMKVLEWNINKRDVSPLVTIIKGIRP